MSVFGNYGIPELADAAEKFISKMDERELAAALEQSEGIMSASSRALLVEAVFDAFRQRGESSQDVAEAAGTTLDAMEKSDEMAIAALIRYAKNNPGLLKEAATILIERHPHIIPELAPPICEGIAQRLRAR